MSVSRPNNVQDHLTRSFSVHALDTIVAKKPAFEGLPIGGLTAVVKQDLALLYAMMPLFGRRTKFLVRSNDTKSFEDALVAIAPVRTFAVVQLVLTCSSTGRRIGCRQRRDRRH